MYTWLCKKEFGSVNIKWVFRRGLESPSPRITQIYQTPDLIGLSNCDVWVEKSGHGFWKQNHDVAMVSRNSRLVLQKLITFFYIKDGYINWVNIMSLCIYNILFKHKWDTLIIYLKCHLFWIYCLQFLIITACYGIVWLVGSWKQKFQEFPLCGHSQLVWGWVRLWQSS